MLKIKNFMDNWLRVDYKLDLDLCNRAGVIFSFTCIYIYFRSLVVYIFNFNHIFKCLYNYFKYNRLHVVNNQLFKTVTCICCFSLYIYLIIFVFSY